MVCAEVSQERCWNAQVSLHPEDGIPELNGYYATQCYVVSGLIVACTLLINTWLFGMDM